MVVFGHLFLIKSERGGRLLERGAFIEINTVGNKSVLIQPSSIIIISCISKLTCFNIITTYYNLLQGCCKMVCVDIQSKKISNDQELIQSDPTSCPQNQKGNN